MMLLLVLLPLVLTRRALRQLLSISPLIYFCLQVYNNIHKNASIKKGIKSSPKYFGTPLNLSGPGWNRTP